jgi:hypothetical protein
MWAGRLDPAPAAAIPFFQITEIVQTLKNLRFHHGPARSESRIAASRRNARQRPED